jgi:hypothetical protein
MKKEVTETTTKIVDICDLCKNKEGYCECNICHRMLCCDCRTLDNFNKWGDYKGDFCQACWDIGKTYRKLENETQEKCDIAMEDIWLEWKKEATKDLTG